MTLKEVKTIIIGAGPAGLAVAGRLREKRMPFEILEQANSVGVTWRNHYDRLRLHTVKKLSALPHLPFPDHYPQYASRKQVVDYLEMYAAHFDIHPHLNTTVDKISKDGNQWKIETQRAQTFQSEQVVIATGVNRIPFVPTWEGQNLYEGQILHSRDYRNPNDISGDRVLVIGMGNTGAELALDLADADKKTHISVRSPVSIIPRDINGRPTQLTAKMLEKFPFGIGEWLGNVVRKVVVGNLSKYGIREPKLAPAKQIKLTGKTPVLDIGTLRHIKSGKIKILPDVDHFDSEGVVTKDGKVYQFDSVLLATGYRAGIEQFLVNTKNLFDDYGVPKNPVGEGDYDGLYFVGFDNYKLGGILGTIRTDSELIVKDMEKRVLAGA